MCDYLLIHGLWPVVCLNGQRFGKNIIGKFVTNMGKRYVVRSLWMGKKMNTVYLCPVSVLTEGWLQQRRILIVKGLGRPILWIWLFLFPHPSLLVPSGLMNTVDMVAGMGRQGLSYMDFHSPRPTWLRLLLGAKSYISRDQPWNWYGTIPQSGQPPTWWQVDYLGLFPSWRGNVLFI